MTRCYIVMKPLPDGSGLIPSGTLVPEASSWRNLEKLISQRYLRLATGEEVSTSQPSKPAKKGKEARNEPGN